MQHRLAVVMLLVGVGMLAAPGMFAAPGVVAASSGEPGSGERAVSGYNQVLEQFVDDAGLVDYTWLKNQRAGLDRYAAYLARLDRRTYAGYNDREKIALWLNAYNAFTLVAIIDHYPIKPSVVKSLMYPKESIRHIPGVWKKLEFMIIGEPVTLDHIEHGILRKDFSEPRIHMALVCASIGCPPLHAVAFAGEALDGQLSAQTRRFLSIERNFRIDRERGVVHLSSIFDWFADDFEGFGKAVTFGYNHDRKHRAALQFVMNYVGEQDRLYIMKERYDVTYLPYDWALNVQSGTQEGP